MRLNPLHPSDNPMYQQLYCFGGPSDSPGGSAGDFDDTVSTSFGGGARGNYESQVDKAARAKGGDNYGSDTLSDQASFDRARAATGDMSVTDQAVGGFDPTADRAAFNAALEAARGPIGGARAFDAAAAAAATGPFYDPESEEERRQRDIEEAQVAATLPNRTLTAEEEKLADLFTEVAGEGLLDSEPSNITPAVREADLLVSGEVGNERVKGAGPDPLSPTTKTEITKQALEPNPNPITDFDFLTGEQLTQARPAFDASASGLRPTNFNEGPTPQSLEEEARQALEGNEPPPSIRTMRGPTFGTEGFEQFGEEDFLPDGVVDQRLEGIAASRAAAAQNPLTQAPDFKGIQIGDVNIPLGPVGTLAQGIATVGTDIYNTFANPTAKVVDNIQNKGHGAVYGVEGSLIGSVDPKTGAVQATEGNAFNRELQPYFDEYNQRQNQGRGSDDPIIPPLIPEDPLMEEQPPEEYQGRDIVGGAPGYQPRGPISFAYTGLPSLAPQKLQPSFQARGQYSPLFPMGQIRRRS